MSHQLLLFLYLCYVFEVLKGTPMIRIGVAKPSTSAPYVEISQVQPQIVPLVQKKKDEEDVSIVKDQIVTLPSTKIFARLIAIK